MKTARILAVTVGIYCLTSLYALYNQISRMLSTQSFLRQSTSGSFTGRSGFRGGFASSANHVALNWSSWLSDLGLICLAITIALFAFSPEPSYPKWLRWIVGLAVVLIIIQVVLSFVHVGGTAANFQRFSRGQFGQSGSGGFPGQTGNYAQPS